MKNKFWNIPNILSFMRIICVPILVIAVILNLKYWIILLILIIGLTDFFDGLLARKFKISSEFGSKMDGIADMLFYYTVLALILIFRWNIVKLYFTQISIIFLLSILVLLYGYIKHRDFIQYHMYIGKASAPFMYYCILGILAFAKNHISIKIAFYIYFTLTIIAHIEKLILITIQKKVKPDTPSVLTEIGVI